MIFRRPLVVRVLVDALPATQFCDRQLTPQTLDHDADFLFGAVLLAGVTADVLYRGFCSRFLLGYACLLCGVNRLLAKKSLFV